MKRDYTKYHKETVRQNLIILFLLSQAGNTSNPFQCESNLLVDNPINLTRQTNLNYGLIEFIRHMINPCMQLVCCQIRVLLDFRNLSNKPTSVM